VTINPVNLNPIDAVSTKWQCFSHENMWQKIAKKNKKKSKKSKKDPIDLKRKQSIANAL